MYSMVPTTLPSMVWPAAPAAAAVADWPAAAGARLVIERAMPKSMIRASSSAVTMMLAGFRSRCTTPAACAAARPEIIERAIFSVR